MKKAVKEEVPLVNIERNPLILLICVFLSAIFIYFGYTLLEKVNPWGFMLLVPAAIFSFQSLWLLLNPFAMIYEDKVEIKQSLFHHKFRFFTDIKKVTETKNGKLYITYNDDEVEPLNLFGIRRSHVGLMRTEMEKQMLLNLQARG